MKKLLTLVLVAVLTFSLSGCGEASSALLAEESSKEAFYSFTDSENNSVVLKEKPKKVAVLFSSLADVWVTAGGKVDITVGETTDRGFADETAVLVDGGAGKTIDKEILIAEKPDFVICSADLEAQKETAELLRKNNIPVAEFRVDSFSDYLSMLKICTDITGNTTAYDEYGVSVQKKIDEIITKTSKEEIEEPKILFIRAGSGADSTKAKTAKDNFVCQMLNELGTYNIAENAPVLLDGLSTEEILRENPYYILVSTMGKEEAAKAYMESVMEDDVWSSLSAVKEDRFAFLPKELFQFKPNSRWAEAYEYLAKLIYPDLF